MVDAVGNEFGDGDYVAYPSKADGEMCLSFGVVIGPPFHSSVKILNYSGRMIDRYAVDVIKVDPRVIDNHSRELLEKSLTRRK